MVCLVTGSSRGLGKAIALALGRRGHSVALHYRERAAEAADVASRLKGAIIIQADAGNHREVSRGVQQVIDTFGAIDLLVNNAGVTKEALLLRTSERDFDSVLSTNLKGPFLFLRAVAPHMKRQKKGQIINISSIAGIQGREGLSAYAASKAGLLGLSRTAAVELGQYNIMVNTVLPGFMPTEMGGSSKKSAQEQARNRSLLKEFSDPARVAEFVCLLSETTGITGQVFNVDSRIIS